MEKEVLGLNDCSVQTERPVVSVFSGGLTLDKQRYRIDNDNYDEPWVEIHFLAPEIKDGFKLEIGRTVLDLFGDGSKVLEDSVDTLKQVSDLLEKKQEGAFMPELLREDISKIAQKIISDLSTITNIKILLKKFENLEESVKEIKGDIKKIKKHLFSEPKHMDDRRRFIQ